MLMPNSCESPQADIRSIMTNAFGQLEEMDKLVNQLGEIMKMKHLITLYELDGETGVPNVDIDEALLRSLLKGIILTKLTCLFLYESEYL